MLFSCFPAFLIIRKPGIQENKKITSNSYFLLSWIPHNKEATNTGEISVLFSCLPAFLIIRNQEYRRTKKRL